MTRRSLGISPVAKKSPVGSSVPEIASRDEFRRRRGKIVEFRSNKQKFPSNMIQLTLAGDLSAHITDMDLSHRRDER